jgi:hypothetical protein
MASHRLESVPLSDASGAVIGYGTGTANEVAQLASLKWSGAPTQEAALEFVRVAALQRLSEARSDAEVRARVKVGGVAYAADSRSVAGRLNILALALRAPSLLSIVPSADGSLTELDANGVYDVCAGVATFLGACAAWESEARAAVTAASTVAEIRSAVSEAALPDFSAGVPAALRSMLPESILSATVTCDTVNAGAVSVRGNAAIEGAVSAASATFDMLATAECSLGVALVSSLNAGGGGITTTGRVVAGVGEIAIVDAETTNVSGSLTAASIAAGSCVLGEATATSIDAGSGAITTTGALAAGQATLGATSVASIQVAGGAVLGNTEVASLDIAGMFQGGGAAFTGLVTFGSASGGNLEATQIDVGSGTMKTTGGVRAGSAVFGTTDAGALTAASVNAGSGTIATSGAIGGGTATIGTIDAVNIGVSGKVTSDLEFAAAGAVRRLLFAGTGVGSGWVAYHPQDTSASNPWNGGPVLEVGVTGSNADSLRIEGGAGIYLKAANRVISTARIEARGGVDAVGNAIATTGPVTCGSLDAGTVRATGAVLAGSLSAGTGTITGGNASLAGPLIATSIDAGSGAIVTAGALTAASAVIGTLANLAISGTVDSDLVFSASGSGERRIRFDSGSNGDSGWITHYRHDSSASNPWFDAAGAHSSVMELGAGDDTGNGADSVRIEGCKGIYLKASDRVISSARIEARGGVDALGNAITTTGAVSCGSLDAGTGAIACGSATINGEVTAASLSVGAFSITGPLSAGAATLGATSTGALTATSIIVGTAGVSTSGDITLVSNGGGARRIRFAGVSDSGWVAFHPHDSSASNPWFDAAGAHSSVMELGAGDDTGSGADSVRIEGCKGIYLKASDRVISSARIEARGGVDALANAITTTGAVTCGSLDAGAGAIACGSATINGEVTAASLSVGAFSITGPLSAGAATLGATSTGALTATSIIVGTGSVSTSGDITLVSNGGGARRIRFAGVSDSGWVAFHPHDSSASNPWFDAAGAHSSVMELGAGDDIGSGADSVRIEGCKGIYLKASDRVISSARIEARGGVDALANAITTTGTISCGVLDAGAGSIACGSVTASGTIEAAGNLVAGACTLGPVSVASLSAGGGAIATTGAIIGGVATLGATTTGALSAASLNAAGGVVTGTLAATGASTLAMTTITAPPITQSFPVGTELVLKGAAVSITGTNASASGLWGSYSRGVEGGDLVLTAGDGRSSGNNGSAASTVNGGAVVIRAGRASTTSDSSGTAVRTFAGAIRLQSGSLQQICNLDGATYVTEMVLQNGRLGVGTDTVAARSETLQVAGSVYASGAATVASLNAGSGEIKTTGAVIAGSATFGTLANLSVSGLVESDLNFSPSGGGVRRIRFAGTSDFGWLAYYAHDSSANNPWYSAASTQNSVMELGVSDDVDVHADSVRIEGGAGIFLKATDRVISSAKIEARGGVDALGSAIATTGAVTCGSISAGTGAIQGGSVAIAGAISAGSLDAGAGPIVTSGSLSAGTCSMGAVTATSLNAGTGSLVGGSATVGELSTTTLGVSGNVTSDLTFAASAGTRRIQFSGGGEGAWVSYVAHDASVSNPWLNTLGASSQNSVLEIGIGDNAGVHADSVRIDGCTGIYLKASDRVIASCKIEARGGVDALGNAVTTTGVVTCGALNAGAGAIQTTGSLAAGTCALGAVSASSVNAGAGPVATTGGVSCGTLNATGSATLAMTTISAPPIAQSFTVGTELVLKGAAVSITGTNASATGLWGSYSRGVEGGDLVLTAGDGRSTGNNGSAASTVNGGAVVIRAGRASTTSDSSGTAVRTFAGAIRFQCGSLQQICNLDAATYVTEMVLQNGRLGVGTDTVAARSETLQVAGSVYASGAATVASLNAGSGEIQTTGAVIAGSATFGTLANLSVSGVVESDLNFSPSGGGVRRIRFAGTSDFGWLAYYAHDSSGNNPWYSAASTQNSVMELGVSDDVDVHADSVRIEGGAGIFLKATDRVISSAKIEARGGVDALGNAIATTGAVTCGSISAGTGAIQGGSAAIAGAVSAGSLNVGAGSIATTGSVTCGSLNAGSGTIAAGACTLGAVAVASLNAGSGLIKTTGALQGGTTTLGATTAGALTASSVAVGSGAIQTTGSVQCGSLNAGAGPIATTGSVATGTLSATGATTLAMTTIAAPSVSQAFSVGTELVYRGAALSITGTTATASGLWGSFSRGVDGGDLVLTAGDGKSVGNNGSAPSTINGGAVVIRAGRASTDSNSNGTVVRTYAGAIRFQCGSLNQANNLDAATYVTEMVLQNGRLGIGTDSVSARTEALQVTGDVYGSGNASVGALDARSGAITTSGAVTAGSLSVGAGTITGGSATVGTLTATNLGVSGNVTSDLTFASSAGTRRVQFSGTSDSGWISYIAHDSSANNPWLNHLGASAQNSVLEVGVGDDLGVHADSVRIEGCAGIYLKAADRVISSCKIEARGGVDALGNAIRTTGTLDAGAATLAGTTCTSLKVGGGGTTIGGIVAQRVAIPSQVRNSDGAPLSLAVTNPFNTTNVAVLTTIQSIHVGVHNDGGMLAHVGVIGAASVAVHICRPKNYNGLGNWANEWGTSQSVLHVQIVAI